MEAAFNNHLILTTVIKNLDFGTLKSLRSINRLWHDITRTELQMRFDVKKFTYRNIMEFYEQEDQLQILDIRANSPVNIRVSRQVPGSWKLLKDIVTHESWNSRITHLQLNNFWVSDLNLVLPYICSKLGSLKHLNLKCVKNSSFAEDTSGIPAHFVFPERKRKIAYNFRTLEISLHARNESGEDLLDMEFLEQCASLERLVIHASTRASFLEFLKMLANLNISGEQLPLCRTVDFYAKNGYSDSNAGRIILRDMANLLNKIKPRSINISNLQCPDLPAFLAAVEFPIETLTLGYPTNDNTEENMNLLMKNLKQVSVLSGLKEIGFQPVLYYDRFGGTLNATACKAKHNLDLVKRLTVDFCKRTEKDMFDKIFIHSNDHLRSVEELKLLGLKFCYKRFMPETSVVNGVRAFSRLKKLTIQIKDVLFALNVALQTARIAGGDGILLPLRVLEGTQLELIEIECDINCDYTEGHVLVGLFGNFEPFTGLNLNIKTNKTRIKRKYTREEFSSALRNANPNEPPLQRPSDSDKDSDTE